MIASNNNEFYDATDFIFFSFGSKVHKLYHSMARLFGFREFFTRTKHDSFLVINSVINRYLLRFFDCLAHPNLSATFATDEK